jgi:hypothetical protein
MRSVFSILEADSRSLRGSRRMVTNLLLSHQPVLVLRALAGDPLLKEFIGPICDLWSKINLLLR